MNLMENSYVLLKKVLAETDNGHRLKSTTRKEIENHVKAVEKDNDFLFEISIKKQE